VRVDAYRFEQGSDANRKQRCMLSFKSTQASVVANGINSASEPLQWPLWACVCLESGGASSAQLADATSLVIAVFPRHNRPGVLDEAGPCWKHAEVALRVAVPLR
jgi:hypothetical protein